MPMIDAFIPEQALATAAEQELIRRVTDLVIREEIGDPANERAQNASWVFVHRPVVYVAGAPAPLPRYRFIISVPEGQFDPERRAAVVRGITEAVALAEGRSMEVVEGRVWVITVEIPDGTWGTRGRIVRLPEMLTVLLGDQGREAALERLAQRAGW
ncbi:MAG TPA: hypothetical protein VJ483_06900 [Holophagaceae bacterium]|nr:hypothetical protein [Holophagaceae bacterium]